MSEPTPGPWEAVCCSITKEVDGIAVEVAVVLRWFPEFHANAQLMAAAPDLLAALEEHLRLWGADQDMPDFTDAIEQARAAVKKARAKAAVS